MLNFDTVTLVGIDGLGGDKETAKAMKYSQKNIQFKESILFSASDDQYDFCDTIKIDKLTYDDCQEFTLTELVDYITTEYVLLVQGDGFVVNPDLWDDNFFSYDYIGAPWPVTAMVVNNSNENVPGWNPKRIKIVESLKESNYEYQVGNGGFTFRSKKLLENVQDTYSSEYSGIAEDAVICVCMRNQLEKNGIKFCPTEEAGLFSCESVLVDNNNNQVLSFNSDSSFGFHCKESHVDKVKLLDAVSL